MRTQQLGLGYLQLDRVGRSLSTSESRRLQLAELVDQHMTQLLILLDEPSAGLTEQEATPLAELIRNHQQLGHTLVLCEHSASMIGLADHIIEVGPGAGDQGGTITFQGAIADLPEDQRSVTRLALQPTSARKKSTKDKSSESLSLSHVNGRGFVDAEFTIPLQGMTILTGPSGSGKRSLVHHAIIPALQQQLTSSTDKPSPAKNPHVSTENLPTITFQATLTGKPRDVLIIDQQLGQRTADRYWRRTSRSLMSCANFLARQTKRRSKACRRAISVSIRRMVDALIATARVIAASRQAGCRLSKFVANRVAASVSNQASWRLNAAA